MKENRQHYEKKYDQVALAPKMGGILTNSKALALINRHPTKCNLCNRLPRATNPPLNRDPATGRIGSSNNTRAEIVVAFCTMDLSWMDKQVFELREHGIVAEKMTIYSKCGRQPSVPRRVRSVSVEIIELGNKGRCDHTYACHISTHFDRLFPVIIFVKDSFLAGSLSETRKMRLPLWIIAMSALMDTTDIKLGTDGTSMKNSGFACGMLPEMAMFSWAHLHTLASFNLNGYKPAHDQQKRMPLRGSRAGIPVDAQALNFTNENYPNLQAFWERALPPGSWKSLSFSSIVPICYGGTFAVRRDRFSGGGSLTAGEWRSIRLSMSRGGNIVESHYMERTWAALLTPRDLVEPSVEKALLCAAERVHNLGAYVGVLENCSCDLFRSCLEPSGGYANQSSSFMLAKFF